MEVTATMVKDWTDYASVAAAIFTALIAWFAFVLSRSLQKARQAESLLNFLERWENDSLVKARQMVSSLTMETLAIAVEEADRASSESYFTLIRVADFFEDMGYACKSAYVRTKDVLDEMGAPVAFYYELYQRVIENLRGREPAKRYKKAYENFQWLKENLGREDPQ